VPTPAPTSQPRPPASTPPPAPTPAPGPLTSEHTSGQLGQTLSLGGYHVTLRLKTTPTDSQCADRFGPAIYELVIVYPKPFEGPSFAVAGQHFNSCRDPGGMVVSGGLYEVFLPAGGPVTVMFNPNNDGHSLHFHFHFH
jgi:hypothetical protein